MSSLTVLEYEILLSKLTVLVNRRIAIRTTNELFFTLLKKFLNLEYILNSKMIRNFYSVKYTC